MQREITDELDLLLDSLPPHVRGPLDDLPDRRDLLEIVMDLGRKPEARFPGRELDLSDIEVSDGDIEYVVGRIGQFGEDNRAGIERTLHRISCIRNRRGRIVGLTCRVGRAVFGTIRVIEDLIQDGSSVLLLGRPGVGKTTMLREMARVLSDDMNKRVVIVDTSNEIGGDGDIPHPSIGASRRMQVARPELQHAVMIEAVENHMPEVIVIDEIGTELEAVAARTINERGVQLVGTAHGNTLENLMMNPTLSDLIGGIQSVTLSDEEARRRGTQKSILERKAPPTFDVVVEIQNWDRVGVHKNVADTVDAILRGYEPRPEVRELDESGRLRLVQPTAAPPVVRDGNVRRLPVAEQGPARQLYPFGISRARLEQAIRSTGVNVDIARDLGDADAVMTLRNYYRRKPQTLRDAEARGMPIYVLKANTQLQMEQSLANFRETTRMRDPIAEAYRETEDAIGEVMQSGRAVELSPQNAYIRRIQHEVAHRFNLSSTSRGREPNRRVRIYPNGGQFDEFRD
jgi:stage III sporulation protein SpoIIIAA